MDIVSQFKKGWSTSEFWVLAVTTIVPLIASLAGYDFDTEGAVAAVGAIFGGLGYATNRTWLKRKRVDGLAAVAAAGPVDDELPDLAPDVGQTDPAVIPPAG